MDVTVTEIVAEKIIEIRGDHVIIDSDVADLYKVETRDINKAVKNNPDKFPEHYIIQLNKKEKNELVENFHRFNGLKHSTTLPKAFTEKGLYMLATILKSQRATTTTLAIIDTFTKVREISRTIKQLPQTPQNTPKYKHLLHKTGELIADLVVPEDIENSEGKYIHWGISLQSAVTRHAK
ncbi:MAG: ORF6N domain-containing protein [Gammaproteobacteria bacterium]|nr:ORF6N domain-containing protein [Gammaproteobacteria bacterium]